MPIEYRKKDVLLREVVSVDDAEALLEYLQKKPAARVDLSACTHVHPANLQVLLAAKARVAHWPTDADLRAWLQSVLPAG